MCWPNLLQGVNFELRLPLNREAVSDEPRRPGRTQGELDAEWSEKIPCAGVWWISWTAARIRVAAGCFRRRAAEQSRAAGLCSYLLRWFYKMRWRTMIATVPCLVSLTLTVDSSSRQVQTPANCFLRSLVAGACRITWRHNAVLFILKQLLHQLRIQQNIRDPPIVVNVKSFVCSTLQKHIPKYCQNVSHLNEW